MPRCFACIISLVPVGWLTAPHPPTHFLGGQRIQPSRWVMAEPRVHAYVHPLILQLVRRNHLVLIPTPFWGPDTDCCALPSELLRQFLLFIPKLRDPQEHLQFKLKIAAV